MAPQTHYKSASRTSSRSHSYPVPTPGCYVPAITFFDPETDRLDLHAQAKYYAYLASTGLRGLVVLGTNAETLLLSREERKSLVQVARSTVPTDYPIIAGVSGHSTAQVLEYIKDAYEAGANFALLLPCAYFGKQTTPTVIKDFFAHVARVSPLPIIIYNFPAVCNGVDLDSDIITEIAKSHDNIVGVKLTCGSVAKIARLAAVFEPSRFAVFGGQSDFLIGGLAVGSAGCIAAFANVFPKSVTLVYDLWQAGRQREALVLQRTLSLAESPTKAGIANTKYAAAVMTAPLAGISNATVLLQPRKPYVQPSEDAKAQIRNIMLPLKYLESGTVKSTNTLMSSFL
jgi:4-hydroxy-2-oxoglutarate aldolase